MTRITLPLFAVALALSLPSSADQPKEYRVTLPTATVGTTALDAGEYKVLIHRDESKAVLQNPRTGDKIDIAGQVQTVERKFDATEVHSQDVNGVKQILKINLGGSKFSVDFPQGI